MSARPFLLSSVCTRSIGSLDFISVDVPTIASAFDLKTSIIAVLLHILKSPGLHVDEG